MHVLYDRYTLCMCYMTGIHCMCYMTGIHCICYMSGIYIVRVLYDRYTLCTTPEAVGALLIAFFPKFPIFSTDNKSVVVSLQGDMLFDSVYLMSCVGTFCMHCFIK